jgi:hypothetical protein
MGTVQQPKVNSEDGKTERLIVKLKLNICSLNIKLNATSGNISSVTPNKGNVIEDVQIRIRFSCYFGIKVLFFLPSVILEDYPLSKNGI